MEIPKFAQPMHIFSFTWILTYKKNVYNLDEKLDKLKTRWKIHLP